MQESSSFNREQKFALGLFFVIAIGTLVFGLRTFGAHVSRPFDLHYRRAQYLGTWLRTPP